LLDIEHYGLLLQPELLECHVSLGLELLDVQPDAVELRQRLGGMR
jgi:hypothetical protein